MKKKTYIQPSVDLVEVESNSLLATSPTLGGEVDNEGGDGDAASYRNNLWDN